MTAVEVTEGDGPLVLGLPHTGTEVPADIRARLNDTGRALADTDWHVDRLYAGLIEGATTVRMRIHRYVVDANRDPSGASLYPGRNTTGLCPVTDFDGRPIYHEGGEPDAAEIARRVEAYHAPYHRALARELARVRDRHGIAVLWDGHSIRSRVPFLFEGELPVLNLGTNDGQSCAPELQAVAWHHVEDAPYSSVLNGRFKGGWTTRHHGRPADGVHALQMEIAQRAYLADEAPPWRFDAARAARLRAALSPILEALTAAAMEFAR